jgi:hypothetical protein
VPQRGELSAERLIADDRARVIEELRRLRPVAPKLEMYDGALETYTRPPASPAECTFARTTECLSADLTRRIAPCQSRPGDLRRIATNRQRRRLGPRRLAGQRDLFRRHT